MCRVGSALLWLVLLLGLQVPSTAATPETTLQKAPRKPVNPLNKLPSIAGIDTKALFRSSPADAMAAYKECQQHGSACKTPCASIANCAGCYPGAKNTTVCGFCMPGTVMSADKKSCTPCKANTFSRGGRTTTCRQCPAGQTAKAGAAGCSGGKGKQGGGCCLGHLVPYRASA